MRARVRARARAFARARGIRYYMGLWKVFYAAYLFLPLAL